MIFVTSFSSKLTFLLWWMMREEIDIAQPAGKILSPKKYTKYFNLCFNKILFKGYSFNALSPIFKSFLKVLWIKGTVGRTRCDSFMHISRYLSWLKSSCRMSLSESPKFSSISLCTLFWTSSWQAKHQISHEIAWAVVSWPKNNHLILITLINFIQSNKTKLIPYYF